MDGPAIAMGKATSVGGVRGEEDIPELGGGSGELDGDERAFGVHHRWADDMSVHLFLGLGILDGNFGASGKPLGKNNHRPAGANSVRGAVNGIGFALDIDENGHPEEHTLSAAALFIGLRAHRGGAALDVWGSSSG